MDPSSRLKALCEQGNSVEIDVNVPIRRYYRSGMEMIKMARIYEEEKNYENAFVLYLRYMTLFIDKIRSHDEFQNYASPEKAQTNKMLKEVMSSAESLKIVIKDNYLREYNEILSNQKMIEETLKQEREEKFKLNKEIQSRKLNIPTTEAHLNNKWDNILITPYDGPIPQDSTIGSMIYPTEVLTYEPSNSLRMIPNLEDSTPHVPSRDLKPLPNQELPSLPNINRDAKPVSLIGGHLESGRSRLRNVAIPKDLMKRFLTLVDSNTVCNIETCGILAGKLAHNNFMITHLLIPQQVGTPDSCTTQHEEELFDQQDKYDLITLGWIHTHPTQTAFLSSVDLHTHCSYQLMMPEAIAIVCAPKFNETGYFTLTQSHGLSFIANCRASGFHPHPLEPPLFQTAEHFYLDPSLSTQIVDLRR